MLGMRTKTTLLLAVLASGLIATRGAEGGAGNQARPIVINKDGSLAGDTNSPTASDQGFVAPRSIEEIAGTAPHVNVPAVTNAAPMQPQVDWKPIVDAMQLMIDQQKLSLKSMEEARTEAVANAKKDSAAMGEKMSKLEDALAAQRTHESETINRMNRLVVGVAAGFAGTGFVVMVLTAWFFMRTMNRVAEINADIQSQLLALPHSQPTLVGQGSGNSPGNQRLLGALEQLEKRIRDLEHTSSGPESGSGGPIITGSTTSSMEPSLGVEAEFVDVDDESSPSVSALMAKGQTLLNLDDAEQALACFDAALQKEPHNADALMKKGTALERLRRMQDALAAYDAALKEDDTLTMAYLAKGGICNRLERYAEALECYERALRVQQEGAI